MSSRTGVHSRRTPRLQLYDCDRCGFTYKKHTLIRQLGMLVCPGCIDDLTKIKQPRPRFFSPRDNSESVAAVNEPTVFPISAGTGIDTISQSREYTREGGRSVYHMYIVGTGGPIDITVIPQIVDGLTGDILTLTGTSDINTVKIEDTGGIAMISGLPVILGDGDSVTFVYNDSFSNTVGGWGQSQWGQTGYGFGGTASAWVETSRTKEAF